jgi:hypothetical protein
MSVKERTLWGRNQHKQESGKVGSKKGYRIKHDEIYIHIYVYICVCIYIYIYIIYEESQIKSTKYYLYKVCRKKGGVKGI